MGAWGGIWERGMGGYGCMGRDMGEGYGWGRVWVHGEGYGRGVWEGMGAWGGIWERGMREQYEWGGMGAWGGIWERGMGGGRGIGGEGKEQEVGRKEREDV